MATNLLTYVSYKKYLKDVIKSQSRGFQASLAKALDCQASYLIQVLNKKGDLTEDQAFKAAEFLKLNASEKDFFLLLVSFSRAASSKLKDYYQGKIEHYLIRLQELKNRVPSSVELDFKISLEYFSNWDVSTVHMATSSPLFQSPEKIATRFRISLERVFSILKFLESNELVQFENDLWGFKGMPVFLAKESNLNSVHQINRREQVVRSIRENDPADIHFASVFSISKEQFLELKSDIRLLIEKSHQQIVNSRSEEIYSLVIDIFKVV